MAYTLHEGRLSEPVENLLNSILLPKGFMVKYSFKGKRYFVLVTSKPGIMSRVVGRFKKHNLIKGLCDPEWIRPPLGDERTCGWCRAFDPTNPDIKYERIRGPIPQLTEDDKRELVMLRLSL